MHLQGGRNFLQSW